MEQEKKFYTLIVFSENFAGLFESGDCGFYPQAGGYRKSECVSLKHRGCSQVHHNGMERRRPDKNNNQAYREENRCDKG